ncbi:hypothetical protein GCM10009096_16960 [Parasphingorhabdus litoris]|uniref:Uncharacterized protein n=1 Tax=Parasphingorhabdus litoris TaxID=394733 RepID=A0ABN1AGD2_9SPHN
MHKHVVAARILDNESETFLRVEKFNFTGAFADNLVWHSATVASAMTAAALSTTIAGVGPRVSLYWGAAIALISIKILITKAITLVPASATPVSIKTHS